MSGFTPDHVAEALVKMLSSGRAHVMVENWRGKPRHLRIYRDFGGFYVRTGKRAVHKNYISAYKKVSDEPFLAVFSAMEDFSTKATGETVQ